MSSCDHERGEKSRKGAQTTAVYSEGRVYLGDPQVQVDDGLSQSEVDVC